MATVFGIDHLVNDKISVKEHIIAGGIDQDKFLAPADLHSFLKVVEIVIL